MLSKPAKLNAAYYGLILIWSTTYMFIKISVGDTPLMAATVRFVAAALILLLFQHFRGRSLRPVAGSAKVIFHIAVLNYGLGYGLTYWAMPYVYSNVVSLLWATMPMFVTLFAHFMVPGERFRWANALSLALALYGSFLIFDVQSLKLGGAQSLAYLMIMLSIAAAAYSNVFYKRTGNRIALDAVLINAYGMLIGGVLLLISSLLTEPWRTLNVDLPWIGATLYLSVFGSTAAFTVYFVLMKYFTVVKMSYTTFLIPIFDSVVGWMVLDEVLGGKTILGGALILAGVVLPDLWRRYKRGRSQITASR